MPEMEVIEQYQGIHSFQRNLTEESEETVQDKKTSCHACGNPLSSGELSEEDQSSEDAPEMLWQRVVKECALCFHGNWIRTEDVIVEKICSGLSNYLFICSLPDTKPVVEDEPRKVLVRIYGEIHRSNLESVIIDSILFAVLSEKKFGPKLYGIFKGGRIEEYIESRPVQTQELVEPEVRAEIATHLAYLHQLDMPLKKQPQFIFGTMAKWVDRLFSLHHRGIDELLIKYKILEEVQWINSVFFEGRSPKFPIAFCHNDLQENNILHVPDSGNDKGFHLQLIDFEYASYNFRAFDFGNHFNEYCFDYTAEKWPCFESRPDNFPSQDEQIQFWRCYCLANPDTSKTSDLEFLEEVYYGSLLSHLFWGVWSLMQQQISSIRFGYLQYAVCRLIAYQKLKKSPPPFLRKC